MTGFHPVREGSSPSTRSNPDVKLGNKFNMVQMISSIVTLWERSY